jgi:hypothetical protein
MSIEVHRTGRTYYPQSTVLLNIPRGDFEGLRSQAGWECVVGAKFLGLDCVSGKHLGDFFGAATPGGGGISMADLDDILDPGLSAEEARERLKAIRAQRSSAATMTGNSICAALTGETGVTADVWKRSAAELLEMVTSFEGQPPPILLSASEDLEESFTLARRLGLKEIDFFAFAPTVSNVSFVRRNARATSGLSRMRSRPRLKRSISSSKASRSL